jgi:hypothetical protein
LVSKRVSITEALFLIPPVKSCSISITIPTASRAISPRTDASGLKNSLFFVKLGLFEGSNAA